MLCNLNSDDNLASWGLKSLVIQLFAEQFRVYNKENIKARHNPQTIGGYPSQSV